MKDYDSALKFEIFQKEEYALAKETIQKADLILDIGGHLGFFSLRCFSLNPQATIHFFEPFPQNFQKAEKNLAPYLTNLHMHNFGFAKSSGNQTFLFNPQKTMQSSQSSSFLNPNGTPQLVECKNLNTYLDTLNTAKIDLIKIDIEGMEFEVLLDLGPHQRKKIKNLILEVHLFSDGDQKNRELLFSTLKNHFSRIKLQPSPYTDIIFLCFASKTNE